MELNDSMILWLGFVALAFVSILILFLSSRRAATLQRVHQSLLDKQITMEQNQNMLLTTMGQNIHNIAVKTLEEGRKVLDISRQTGENKDVLFANVENKLLGVTTDLISFLRLKSEKIEILNEEFNINNILNEVSGSICRKFTGSQSELIFEIDKNVPRRLIGDSLHIEKILESILEYQMGQGTAIEVKLKIAMFNTHGNSVDMQFSITDTGSGIDENTVESLFNPYYDEALGGYVGLGLFISNELVNLMDGTLSVQSTMGRGNTFTLSLPLYVHDKANQRRYRLPKKGLIEKKVLIVDEHYNAALAIKEMFAYFRHEVTVLSLNDFHKERADFRAFDIVVLHQNIFDATLIEYIQEVKAEKTFHVVALNALLRTNKSDFIDTSIDSYLFKPVNQERIFELIICLYDKKEEILLENKVSSEAMVAPMKEIHKSHIVETKGITPESFKVFGGKHLLIVEDNIINQKVLSNILNISRMKISIVNNGQEAVEIVTKGIHTFDLVLMDINMPIMDGYSATQMIRLDKKFDSLPIVAFTALVLDSEVTKMFHAGINVFLSKPLNIGKLYTVFTMYLREASLPKVRPQKPIKRIIKKYEGIDISIGIAHSNKSEALYVELLKEFSEAYGTSDTVFTSLVTEHRYAQIKMLCVDMKGLAGTIGANDMQVLVTEVLQLLLYNKHALIANYTEAYSFEITKLDASIQEYLADIA
ncbi:MAG: response regulator [Sulfurovum sp.]|nr:response regulator [Sulfurovum sp.]